MNLDNLDPEEVGDFIYKSAMQIIINNDHVITPEAILHLERAYILNNPNASYVLSQIYMDPSFKMLDYDKGLMYLKHAASLGQIHAIENLKLLEKHGNNYKHNNSIEYELRNIDFDDIVKEIENGPLFNVSAKHYYGQVDTINIMQGIGSIDKFMAKYTSLRIKDINAYLLDLLYESANNKYPYASLLLALIYNKGLFNIIKDQKKALDYLIMSAKYGCIKSQNILQKHDIEY